MIRRVINTSTSEEPTEDSHVGSGEIDPFTKLLLDLSILGQSTLSYYQVS